MFIGACSSPKKAPETPMPAPQATPAPVKAPEVKWGYDGMLGPNFWSSIDGKYGTCKSGKSQSPIDLVWKRPTKKGSLKVDYKQGKFGVIDNGHTIQVNVPIGSQMTIAGHTYQLKSFHFHSSSEHTLSGNQLAMEVHFVHQDEKGLMAVVSAFIIEGADNPILGEIFNNKPSEKNVEKVVENMTFNPAHILPKIQTYYQYTGSLTTPPCTEGVNWVVLNTPVTVSKEQLLQFRKHYPKNFRPTQPLNGRKVTNFL